MNKELFQTDIHQAENGIWEVSGIPVGSYDGQAAQYDKLISNGLYNRIMWKNKPSDYAVFQKENLNGVRQGVVADIGCGTLGFTSGVYARYEGQETYLCDFSMEMLKLGKQKLQSLLPNLQTHHFLRADALNMPFKDGVVDTILSYGLLHIFDEPKQLLKEFYRILPTGGDLHMTVLCTDRRFSARYLNWLHKKGHVAKPMHSSQIIQLITEFGFQIMYRKVKGGMFYVSVRK